MKVDGNAFKRAREDIRKDAGGRRGTRENPSEGTIEWLSRASGCGVRTIKNLESGAASLETVDKISPYLKIDGRQLIYNFGSEEIICETNNVIDFRPTKHPVGNPRFEGNPMIMTLDPLSITCKSNDITEVYLEKVSAKLYGLKRTLSFEWLYFVSLTEAGVGWLGITSEAHPFKIAISEEAELMHLPVMLKQAEINQIQWSEFVEMVYSCENNELKISVDVTFNRFRRQFHRFVSVELLIKLFDDDMTRRNVKWPYWVQCKLMSSD